MAEGLRNLNPGEQEELLKYIDLQLNNIRQGKKVLTFPCKARIQ